MTESSNQRRICGIGAMFAGTTSRDSEGVDGVALTLLNSARPTPAEIHQIKKGDILTAVSRWNNGDWLTPEIYPDFHKLVAGPPGTMVGVEIYKPESGKSIRLSMVREEIVYLSGPGTPTPLTPEEIRLVPEDSHSQCNPEVADAENPTHGLGQLSAKPPATRTKLA